MLRLLSMFGFVLFCFISIALAEMPDIGEDEIKAEVQRSFEGILDLWRDGKYNDLYERTIAGGKQSKESFIKTLSTSLRKPACCWEKMQDVKVKLGYDDTATIKAKLGFKDGGATEFSTREIKMSKDEGVWKVSMSDILSLAGASKKKGDKGQHKKRHRKNTAGT